MFSRILPPRAWFESSLKAQIGIRGRPFGIRTLRELVFWYEKPTDVLLLKPHGSVDWFENTSLPPKTQKAVQKLDYELVVYPRFDFAEYRDLEDVAPVIVPAVSSKQFDRPFLKQTWKAIYRSVSAGR